MTTSRSVPFLIQPPCLALVPSYRTLVEEFRGAGEPLIPFVLAMPHTDGPALIARLAAHARGEEIPAGFVAHSTFWLSAGDQVLGVSNVRHVLTDALRHDGGTIGYGVRPSARRRGVARALLHHALAVSRDLGMPEVWLTCDHGNEGSARTIRGAGGLLMSEAWIPERATRVQRYRMPLR